MLYYFSGWFIYWVDDVWIAFWFLYKQCCIISVDGLFTEWMMCGLPFNFFFNNAALFQWMVYLLSGLDGLPVQWLVEEVNNREIEYVLVLSLVVKIVLVIQLLLGNVLRHHVQVIIVIVFKLSLPPLSQSKDYHSRLIFLKGVHFVCNSYTNVCL